MKKSLLALAVLGAFAGAAQAQTGVTVYGSFDGGLRSLSNADGAGKHKTTMSSNGTYNSNRIGFKGTEDLGGGLNAHFALETGFNTGTGELDNANNQLFNRTALVGLGGAWGSLDLGRQYSINFQTIGLYDPFNYKYTGIVPLAGQGGLTRLNNDVKYTGKFGPVTAQAEYALGEVAGSTSNGSTYAVGGSYAGGPFTAGLAYTHSDNTTGTAAQRNWTAGGAYATGPFRVAVGYADRKTDAGFIVVKTSATVPATVTAINAALTDTKDWWVGGSYNITPAAALSAGYYQTKYSATGTSANRKLFIIGATYALSKRTNFYVDVDSKRYDTGAGLVNNVVNDNNQTGFSVGINHLF